MSRLNSHSGIISVPIMILCLSCSALNSLDDYTFAHSTDSQTGSDTSTSSDSTTDTNDAEGTDTASDSKSDSETGSGTTSDNDTVTDSNSDSDTGSDSNSDSDSETGTGSDSETGTESDSETAVDTCGGSTYTQCSGPDVGTYDLCAELISINPCPAYQECVNLTTTEAVCQCMGNRTGSDCTECLAGYGDKNNDCSTCVRFVDVNASGTADGLTWENAFTGVQGGIFAAEAAMTSVDWPDLCEVWIKSGEYSPTQGTGSNASFLLSANISLYGGFSDADTVWSARDFENNVTVLNGGSVYHVVTGADQTRLDGFTVTGGRAYGDPGITLAQYGAGVIADGISMEIWNSVFQTNAADYKGGAVYALNNATILIENTRFSGNSAESDGGAVAADDSTLTVNNCNFTENITNHTSDVGDGGAISVENGADLVITESIFTDCSARDSAGAINAVDSTVLIENTTVSNNAASYGGAGLRVNRGTLACEGVRFLNNIVNNTGTGGAIELTSVTDAAFINCIIAGNSVGGGSADPRGGGMYTSASTVEITNCTIAYNNTDTIHEPHAGGVFANSTSTITLLNTIIWGNTCSGGDSEICGLETEVGTALTATYNDLQGISMNPAYNNINVDPNFASGTDPFDFHLQSPTDCLDGGTNSGAPSVDIDGVSRPLSNGYDIGAYEQ